MIARSAAAVLSVSACVLAMSVTLAGQESLASARQLYAAAEYQDALAMLDGLLKRNPLPPDRQTIDLYRTFCLFALGGVKEAAVAVDAMIARDPLYHPNADEVPPRLRTLFADARRRLLPGLIQQRYVAAKAAFDRSDYRAASEGFTQVLIALSDPDVATAAAQPPLADLRVLASGFNDLTIRSLSPPPASASAASPAGASGQPALPAVPANRTAPPAPRALAVYTKDARDVVEPVAISQALPPYPGRVTTAKTGAVEVVIDETGAVESASMVNTGVDPIYNRVVLVAARTWTYRPATRDGVPVKFRKRVQIALSPGS